MRIMVSVALLWDAVVEERRTRAVLWEREVAMVLVDDDAGFLIGQGLLLIVGQDAMRDSASMLFVESAEWVTNDWLVTSSILLLWT